MPIDLNAQSFQFLLVGNRTFLSCKTSEYNGTDIKTVTPESID